MKKIILILLAVLVVVVIFVSFSRSEIDKNINASLKYFDREVVKEIPELIANKEVEKALIKLEKVIDYIDHDIYYYAVEMKNEKLSEEDRQRCAYLKTAFHVTNVQILKPMYESLKYKNMKPPEYKKILDQVLEQHINKIR